MGARRMAMSESEPENEGAFHSERERERQQAMNLKRRVKRWSLKLLNLYPPYVGAGISVTGIADDLSWFEVQMKALPWNRNYFGTHFGGSLYSMCDPFFALILTEHLGPGYVVWDKAAQIRFKKPGHGTMRARFAIDPLDIDAIAAQADTERKVEPVFTVSILNDNNEVVAEIEKTLYVRKQGKRDGQLEAVK